MSHAKIQMKKTLRMLMLAHGLRARTQPAYVWVRLMGDLGARLVRALLSKILAYFSCAAHATDWRPAAETPTQRS